MSTETTLTFTLDSDGIALVRLDAPTADARRAAPHSLQTVIATLQALGENARIAGIVLHACGCDWLEAESAQDWLDLCSLRDAREISGRLLQRSKQLRAVEQLAKPVAIVLENDCLDLCLEFALACHYRVAAGGRKLRLGFPLIQRGLPPSAGATQRLPRIAGIPAALALLLSGHTWDVDTARRAGVLSDAQPTADEAVASARHWLLGHPQPQAPWDAKGYRVPQGAGAMAAHASRSFTDNIASLRKTTHDTQPAPPAILSAVYEGTQLPIDAALHIEAQCAAQALADPASANQIRTLWLHADQARQLVRQPQGIEPAAARKLGILGAGLMGAGIAQVAAAAGIDVVLIDSTAERARAALEKLRGSLERQFAGKQGRTDSIVARIDASADMQRLRGCDFVIEAVFEDRSVKADLMRRAAHALGDRPPDFVWASNTSTLPIHGLAGYWELPQQVIGMHFFSPVARMPLLEIITGPATSSTTLARAMDLAARLGKTPILVNDSPGFYTSRIFCAYIDEGMAMLAEGVNPALIENAARQAGFATSPLAVTDEVSLDLQALVINQAMRDGLPEKFQRRAARAVVDRMNQLGRLGRKSGCGFYDYPPDGVKRLWPGLASEFPLLARQPSVDTVRTRLLHMQALEAARCIEESVLTSAADGDIGSILGLGFPVWTGGALSYIDTVGCDTFVKQCDALAELHGERWRPSPWLRERADRRLTFHGRGSTDTPAAARHPA